MKDCVLSTDLSAPNFFIEDFRFLNGDPLRCTFRVPAGVLSLPPGMDPVPLMVSGRLVKVIPEQLNATGLGGEVVALVVG